MDVFLVEVVVIVIMIMLAIEKHRGNWNLDMIGKFKYIYDYISLKK